MLTLSMFYEILIQKYWDEHAPQRFHAIHVVKAQIRQGRLPRRVT